MLNRVAFLAALRSAGNRGEAHPNPNPNSSALGIGPGLGERPLGLGDFLVGGRERRVDRRLNLDELLVGRREEWGIKGKGREDWH